MKMKTPARLSFNSARRRLAGALLAASLAAGCGGGGSSGGVDTGGTGAALTFSAGRIAGFGSIIVNDVRFDDSTARIVVDDGVAHVRGDLKLGMQTAVQAGPISVDASSGVAASKATTIEFASQIKGLVESVNVAAGTFAALGQTVKVDAATVFDGLAAGLGSLRAGNLVEVYAFFDTASASYTATRVELKPSLADYKLAGAVAGLNTVAKTFTIGGATISYAGVPATALPALGNGVVVRARLQPARQGGVWIATTLAGDTPAVADGAETEVEGFITDFSGSGSFKVGGVKVDASGPGVVFKSGSAASLANGVRIEVEGVTRAGVLAARRIDVKASGGGDQQFELRGAIESVNPAAQSFVLRGVPVSYGGATRFDDGSAANLLVGALVEVKGVLSASGTQLAAARIKFDR